MRDAILIGLGALLGTITANIDGHLERIAAAIILGAATGTLIAIGTALHNRYSA